MCSALLFHIFARLWIAPADAPGRSSNWFQRPTSFSFFLLRLPLFIPRAFCSCFTIISYRLRAAISRLLNDGTSAHHVLSVKNKMPKDNPPWWQWHLASWSHNSRAEGVQLLLGCSKAQVPVVCEHLERVRALGEGLLLARHERRMLLLLMIPSTSQS